MLLTFFMLFTPASVRSDWASNIEAASNPDDLIEKGILFNEVSKILLTENFIRVEFLVPFPTYDFTMKPDIEKMIQQLSLMWKTPSLFCPLNFSSQFATNTSGFNVHSMLHQIDNETSAAQLDLALIRNETAMFLKPLQPTKSTRQRRGAGFGVGLAALAAVGLFGGGLAVGSSDSCCLRGIFGNCQDQSKANAENIRRLSDFQNSLADYVTEFITNTDEKFFLVENELAALNAIQSEMAATQDKNWVIIQEQLAVYEQNFHILRDCDQLLFANQQLNFLFDTVSSSLSMIHASVKSYRSGLFAFRMNILNSILVLLKGHLPMSLIPMESLLAIMDSVSLRQSKAEDRLTLAIPASDLLSYYDSRLLADALTVSEGLLLTLNTPLASQQTVFTLFEAKLIPMPFPDDPQTALTWNIEAPYLALSENKLESSVLSEEQFEHCLGSSKYRICSEAFPTQIGHPCCIATLYFFSPIDALAVCETIAITLPSIEQATNLGFGIWLITSANADFTFRESSSLATSTSSRSFVGCHICIITLACGMQIHMGHIIIRSDLASCSTIPAITLRLSLPDLLQSLIMQVPPLDDLPLYTSKAEAGVALLKAVRKKLISSPRVRQVNHLVEIARPFAQDMKLLKPSLTREFNQYVPFKVSFTLTVIVFIVSTVLHLVFLYVYHRFNLKDRIFPKKTAKKNAIKPVLHVPHDCSPAVFEKLSKRYHFLPLNEKTAGILPLPPKKAIPEFHQQAASSSFAAP